MSVTRSSAVQPLLGLQVHQAFDDYSGSGMLQTSNLHKNGDDEVAAMRSRTSTQISSHCSSAVQPLLGLQVHQAPDCYSGSGMLRPPWTRHEGLGRLLCVLSDCAYAAQETRHPNSLLMGLPHTSPNVHAPVTNQARLTAAVQPCVVDACSSIGSQRCTCQAAWGPQLLLQHCKRILRY